MWRTSNIRIHKHTYYTQKHTLYTNILFTHIYILSITFLSVMSLSVTFLSDRDNVEDSRGPGRTVCLGSVRHPGSSSIFSLWRNGESLSDLCNTHAAGIFTRTQTHILMSVIRSPDLFSSIMWQLISYLLCLSLYRPETNLCPMWV